MKTHGGASLLKLSRCSSHGQCWDGRVPGNAIMFVSGSKMGKRERINVIINSEIYLRINLSLWKLNISQGCPKSAEVGHQVLTPLTSST